MARARVVVDIPPSLGFFGITALLVFLAVLVYCIQMRASAPTTVSLPPQEKPAVSSTVVVANEGGDDRYTRAPQPQRFWNNGPEIPIRGALIPADGARMINIPTQGLPEAYQSMGLLKTPDGKMLPLFGRRVASRSDRFNYYTRTDTYNPVPLPIRFQKKDCQDPVGCQELFDGDSIQIIPTGETASATLYRFDGPLYVPHIL